MKNFSIIIDEQSKKRVVPSKWLVEGNTKIKWPLSTLASEIKKLIINLAEPDEDWELYDVTKFIKYNDDYNKAVEEMNFAEVENLSDPTDECKMKNTRHDRNKKDFLRIMAKTSKNENSKKRKREEIDEEENVLSTQDKSKADQINLPNVTTLSVLQTELQPEVVSLSTINDRLKLVITNQNIILRRLDKLDKIMNNSRNAQSISSIGRSPKPGVQMVQKYFPIDDDEDNNLTKISVVEEQLKNKSFLANVIEFMKNKGGGNPHDLIYNIMTAIMKNSVAQKYSFFGQKKKLPFHILTICQCICLATKHVFPNTTDDDIKKSIKNWLDASSTRYKRESLMQTKNKRQPFEPLALDNTDNSEDEQ